MMIGDPDDDDDEEFYGLNYANPETLPPPITLQDVIEAGEALAKLDLPPMLKSITLHPDDYAVLYTKATKKEHCEIAIYSLVIGGVMVFKDPNVPKGKPKYDPPECEPRAITKADAIPIDPFRDSYFHPRRWF